MGRRFATLSSGQKRKAARMRLVKNCSKWLEPSKSRTATLQTKSQRWKRRVDRVTSKCPTRFAPNWPLLGSLSKSRKTELAGNESKRPDASARISFVYEAGRSVGR